MTIYAKQSTVFMTTCGSRKMRIPFSDAFSCFPTYPVPNLAPSILELPGFVSFVTFLFRQWGFFLLGLTTETRYNAIQRAKWCDIKPSTCLRQAHIDVLLNATEYNAKHSNRVLHQALSSNTTYYSQDCVYRLALFRLANDPKYPHVSQASP